MQFARCFWECMFVDDCEEFIYTLFSKFDVPFCSHGNGKDDEERENKDGGMGYIRNACTECLETFITRIKTTRSTIRLYCMRNYANRKGFNFTILFYPFSGEDFCVNLDFVPEKFVKFTLDCIKGDMLCDKTNSLMGTVIEFKNCRFDEEIDMLNNRGNLRLLLLFRFFLLESLRSRDVVGQRGRIFDLMLKYRLMNPETSRREFCETYDHKKFASLCKEEISALIQ